MDKTEELNALRQSNREKLQTLQTQGVALEPPSVVMLRLNAFMDFLKDHLQLSDDDITAFEIRFETAIAELLDAGTQQVNRAVLLSPLHQRPGGGFITPNGRPS